MTVFDFEYDGTRLSDLGYVICNFNGMGIETVSNGSKIAFKTVPLYYGRHHALTHSVYEECLTATFSICKNPCTSTNNTFEYILTDDIRMISRWLNRKEFCKLRLLSDGYKDIYFEGSFNIDLIRNGRNVIGLQLTFTSNRPFAIHDTISYSFIVNDVNAQYTIIDTSDEIGYIYATFKITCIEDGDLIIFNDIENISTVITNCKQGEVLHIQHPIITTTLISHDVCNDFNYSFPRIANTPTNNVNNFKFSIPCNVTVEYSPIVKVGI